MNRMETSEIINATYPLGLNKSVFNGFNVSLFMYRKIALECLQRAMLRLHDANICHLRLS